MDSIKVNKISETSYKVVVESRTTTVHEVTLTPEYYSHISDGTLEPEDLIEASFLFLLDREPNTSILRQFDLTVISRYFPRFEQEIKEYF